MTDISATAFFRQAAGSEGLNFEHEEEDTGSSIWPTRIKLKALHPDTGEEMGFLDYQVPRRKADKITVHRLETHEGHTRKGVGSALMDEMQRRHPATPIDHGTRTPDGKAWWKNYIDGKTVRRGRTIATLAFQRTAVAETGDDVPSRLLNPHGHHIKVNVGGHRNVEFVPRDEIARYASQETDKAHAKEVGLHMANSGEMEPLILHYHPKSGEAYLGEGNHRLRVSYPMQMEHLPVRVTRYNEGLPGPGVKTPKAHPATAAGTHVPYDIKPSDIGLTTVDKPPAMSEWDKNSERLNYNLLKQHEASADHIELHRGLNLGLASAEDIEHLHRDPVGYLNKRGFDAQRAGIHWSSNPYTAHNFALAHEDDEDDETPYTHGVVLHARVAPHHIVQHGTDEWQQYADENEIYDSDHPENEHTVRRNAPVHITGVTATSRHMYGGEDRETPAPWGHHVTASADTPVPDNHEPYQHHHDWLPHDHFFAPGKKGLDQRLFDEHDHMHPEVRQHLLSLLNGFWAPRYGDSWQSWARVYLAGSEASHWYGNNDLDVLIGVHYQRAREHSPALAGMSDHEIDTHLTDELRRGLNDDQRMLPGPDGKDTGPWESTWYCNPGSYDIRQLKPYAAYDITHDEWAVKPVEVPGDFGPEKLPESTWDVFDAVQKLIKAIGELPEGTREREGSALYDYLHADRHSAFGPDGTGLYDPANATWKALDKAPGKPLQQLIDWKRVHDGAAAATDQETAA